MKKINTKTIILIGILVMICAIAGVSYAVWQITLTQEDDNLITSSCFQVSIDDKNPITLQNTIPFTDQEGKDLTPYTFTIHNECGENALYEINYEILDDTTFKNDEDRFIKIMLQDNEPELLNELDPTEKTLKEANRAYKIEEGYIKANETKEYKLRVWLDKDVTIEDDVMGKSLSSKITITARYDRGIVTSPEVELALSRCSNNIIAKIKTTGNAIASYEYQIDEEEPITEEKDAYTFENKARGETHKVKVKITDIYGNVIEKEEEINIPDYPTLLGKQIGTDIPIVESGSGLYEVTHCDITGTTNDEGFAIEEYRYAGSNPNNYIKYNDEDWRIIGLANVLVPQTDGSNKVEQRVKIVRNQPLDTQMAWDTESQNDWTKASLMKHLNGVYYNEFNENSKNMVEEKIIWNIGGWYRSMELVTKYYEFERGNSTYSSERPIFWTAENTTKEAIFHSIGLIYPSDYGFAVSDETNLRKECFNLDLYHWENKQECSKNDWLSKTDTSSYYTITPSTDDGIRVFRIMPIRVSIPDYYNVTTLNSIFPSLYLKSDVHITSGSGQSTDSTDAYQLAIK